MSYDEIISRAVSGGIVELFKRTLDVVSPRLAKASAAIGAFDLAGTIARKYADTMVPRYGSMRIFGMQHPIPLIDIYTQVNVLEDITAQRRLSVDELNRELDREYKEEFSGIGQRQFGKVRVTRTGIEAFSELDRFVLLGKPGSGKTTFLKHIFLSTLMCQIEGNRIPVMISLNQAADHDNGILGMIHREFDICGVENSTEFARQSLADGGFVLLLDGLDEVREDRRSAIIRQITDISDQYPNNKFVVTCRVAAYSYWLERFSNVEIADFHHDQIVDFVQRWFRNLPETADHFIAALSRSRSLQSLSRTPLLLTIMCVAYAETLNISENRAELYRDAVDALLKRWDASRAIKRDEFYKELTLKRKEDLFAYMASETFPRNQFFLKRSEWESYAVRYLKNLPNISQNTIADDAGTIIEAIAAQHGILVERAAGIFSFSHLTFVEYFMARYANDAGADYQISLVKECIASDQWREVIILLSCLVNNADHLLIALLESSTKYGFDPKPVKGLKISLQRSAANSKSGFDLGRMQSSAVERPVLQVVGGVSEPTLLDVETTIGNRKRGFLPRAIDQLSMRAYSIAREFCANAQFMTASLSENPASKIPRSIYKSLLKRVEQRYSDMEKANLSPKFLEEYIKLEYREFCLGRCYKGLDKLGEDVRDVISMEFSGNYDRKEVRILGRRQKRPNDIIEARDMIVAGVIGVFEDAFGTKALAIKDEAIDQIRQTLFIATDPNDDPELRYESTYLYIADLLFDLLKQPVATKPEVRKAVMWTLLSQGETPDEPSAPERRMRHA